MAKDKNTGEKKLAEEKNTAEIKKKNIARRITNGIVIILTALIGIFAFLSITSLDKGYTNAFGMAILGVESDSMKKDLDKNTVNKDNFKRGDLIFVKVLSSKGKNKLKEGDVITFYDKNISKNLELNTHRIVRIIISFDGSRTYETRGDNNPNVDSQKLSNKDIIGVYKGKLKGVGKFNLFLKTQWGFFGIIVIPSFFILGYFAIMVILNAMQFKKVKGEVDIDTLKNQLRQEILREQLKEELLKEIQAELLKGSTQKGLSIAATEENAFENTPEKVKENITEKIVEDISEIIPENKFTTVTAAKSKPASTAKTKTESAIKSKSASATKTKAGFTAKSKPTSTTKTKTESAAKSKPVTATKTKAESVAKSKPASTTRVKSVKKVEKEESIEKKSEDLDKS